MIEFYVGQRVWCAILGEGVVAETAHDVYPVKVRFENGEVESYTSEDHWAVRHGNRALFHNPVKIVQDESATKPSIDWSLVKEDYKWLSVDKDGSAYVSTHEPMRNGTNYWYSPIKGDFSQVNWLVSYSRGTCQWEDSLVKRPK